MTQTLDIDAAARDILRRNDKGTYTVPTEGLYPYQWNWDSSFAAMGFAEFDIKRAWLELETLFSGQWHHGMVPHILFHTRDEGYFPGPEVWQGTGSIPSSGITQPPIAATMAKKIFDRDPELGRKAMQLLFDKMLAWHDWFITWRLDKGAVCSTHPWEAGRDNAPDWDIAMSAIDASDVGEYTRRDIAYVGDAMRPTKFDYDRYIWLIKRGALLGWDEEKMLKVTAFRVADTSLTFMLLRASRDLAAIGEQLGRDVSTIQKHIVILEAGVQTLWNAELGSYDSRDVCTSQWSNSISNASFLCWYAGIAAPEMRETFARVMSGVDYGVPSFDPSNPKFDSKRYWRGPVWGVMNMLIAMGMDDMAMKEGAELRRSTASLISQHGFSEYFDPTDGSPAGGQLFTWTAAIWLGWASPNTRKF